MIDLGEATQHQVQRSKLRIGTATKIVGLVNIDEVDDPTNAPSSYSSLRTCMEITPLVLCPSSVLLQTELAVSSKEWTGGNAKL